MRVLLVEDETELADLVAKAIGRAGHIVDAVGTLEEADAAMATVAYDCAILDLGLPDGDGLDLLRRQRRAGSHVPVLILTARDAVRERVAGLEAGADDYVLKPFHIPELIARLNAILRRPSRMVAGVLTCGNLSYDLGTHRASVGGEDLTLTRRELALLEAMLRQQGRVVPRQRLEDSLYGMNEEVGSNALEVLVHRVRKKLSDGDSGVRLHTIRGVGYLMDAA